MKDFSKFNPTLSFALLLLGAPGTGKTLNSVLAMPSPYVADLDNNLLSVHNYFRENKINKTFFYDTINVQCINPPDRWLYLERCLKEALKDPRVESIIIDSLSMLGDYLMDWILAKQGREFPEIRDWGQFKERLPKFITMLRSVGKPIVVIAHQKWTTEESTQQNEMRVNISGSNANDFAKWFSDYYHAEILFKKEAEVDAKGKPTGKVITNTRYVVRTAPLANVGTFKRSFKAPDVCPLNETLLAGIVKVKPLLATLPTTPTPLTPEEALEDKEKTN